MRPIKTFAYLVAFLMVAYALPRACLAADAPPRPNIVVILADDIGFFPIRNTHRF